MNVTNELVQVFWEDGVAVGMLHLNGHAQFYRISHANKEFIGTLIGADVKEEEPKI